MEWCTANGAIWKFGSYVTIAKQIKYSVMKNLLIIAAIILASCTKEVINPANSTQESKLRTEDTVHISPDLNFLHSYMFFCDTERLSKLQYEVVSNADSISLKGFQVTVNERKVPITPFYENKLITITFQHLPLMNGQTFIDFFARTKVAGFKLVLTRIETTKRILVLQAESPYYIN